MAREPVRPDQIRLVEGKGSKDRGGGPGGGYWHIHVDDRRVGTVYVNVIDEPPIGRHASLQIHINKPDQGRKIARVAYRLASEASGHDMVFAHMRKSNIASRKAAEAAGYEVVDDDRVRQLLMRWRR
jgi:RimJ/RimL family protein N-acetyltransferase